MTIQETTKKYEAWLSAQTVLVADDVQKKHEAMAAAVFPFLRATFYRWTELWPAVCAALASAPKVLAVGDLHIENFGTWRDSEGRLVWGINDFDEAYPAAYTADLVRLATSASLAISSQHLAIDPKDACTAILTGYQEGLQSGGMPIVLGEHHGWLRKLATDDLRDPADFWAKQALLPTYDAELPKGVLAALAALLPESNLPLRVAARTAGLGSLGRLRFIALADWKGSKIAREAKAMVPSAWSWVAGDSAPTASYYTTLLQKAVRCRDPFVQQVDSWIVRRLAPDCCRVEIGELTKAKDTARLLAAMGSETANIHLGSAAAVPDILQDLSRRPPQWLADAAEAMARETSNDWEHFRAGP